MTRKSQRSQPRPRSTWTERLGVSAVGRFLRRRGRRFGRLCGRALALGLAALLAPFRFARAVLYRTARAFLYSWTNVRWRTVWFGLPFALALVGSALLAVTSRAGNQPLQLAQTYRDAARLAMMRRDVQAAELYYERLAQFPGGHENDILYNIAFAADALDKDERVDAILRELAPLDRPGYGPAHVWQARRLAEQGELSRDQLQQVNTHLAYAVRLEPNNSEAHELLGAYYMNTGRYPLAAEHLLIAVRDNPSLYLPLAKVHALQGRTEQAANYGRLAKEFFRRKVEGNPRGVSARLDWADATMFLEQFPEAVEIMREGLELTDDKVYRDALARLYGTWSDSIRGQSVDARREKLRLLELGISYNPDEVTLFDRLTGFLRRDDDASGSARELLVAMIARGKSPKLAHLLLGTDEGERGNFDKAIQHLEQAYRLDPSMPIVANNLAWYLLQTKSIDIKRAYELVSALSERWPLMAQIHDTRGQLLVRMERWREAAAELEKAIPYHVGRPDTHRALVQVYEELGMTELAQEHRRILQSLDRRPTATP